MTVRAFGQLVGGRRAADDQLAGLGVADNDGIVMLSTRQKISATGRVGGRRGTKGTTHRTISRLSREEYGTRDIEAQKCHIRMISRTVCAGSICRTDHIFSPRCCGFTSEVVVCLLSSLDPSRWPALSNGDVKSGDGTHLACDVSLTTSSTSKATLC